MFSPGKNAFEVVLSLFLGYSIYVLPGCFLKVCAFLYAAEQTAVVHDT